MSSQKPIDRETIRIMRVFGDLARHPNEKRVVDVKGFVYEWSESNRNCGYSEHRARGDGILHLISTRIMKSLTRTSELPAQQRVREDEEFHRHVPNE
jgi:hypothetical protein